MREGSLSIFQLQPLTVKNKNKNQNSMCKDIRLILLLYSSPMPFTRILDINFHDYLSTLEMSPRHPAFTQDLFQIQNLSDIKRLANELDL